MLTLNIFNTYWQFPANIPKFNGCFLAHLSFRIAQSIILHMLNRQAIGGDNAFSSRSCYNVKVIFIKKEVM